MQTIITSGKKLVGEMSRNGDMAGVKNCEAYIGWKLKQKDNGDVVFAMSGAVWNHIKTDIFMGGQCVDKIVEVIKPSDPVFYRMVEVWRRWHLNDLRAGTPKQEAAIKKWGADGNTYSYSAACEYLKSIGLYEDGGYTYGSAWLCEKIPAEIIEEIKSW